MLVTHDGIECVVSFPIVDVDGGKKRGKVRESDLEGVPNESASIVDQCGDSATDVVVIAGSNGEATGTDTVVTVAAVWVAVFAKTKAMFSEGGVPVLSLIHI